MQSDDIFTISNVNNLFFIESNGWKYADLFAVKID